MIWESIGPRLDLEGRADVAKHMECQCSSRIPARWNEYNNQVVKEGSLTQHLGRTLVGDEHSRCGVGLLPISGADSREDFVAGIRFRSSDPDALDALGDSRSW